MTFMRKILDVLNMDNWHNASCTHLHSEEIISPNLSLYYNGTLPKRREEQIARDILSAVGICSPMTSSLCSEATAYLTSNPSRIELCVYGAQICIPPVNNNELYLISHAYDYAGATYRREAIYWYKKYIENGAVSDYRQSFILHKDKYSYDQRIAGVAIAHSTLAKLYAEEKLYDESNKEYELATSIAPFFPSNYINLAKNYIQQRMFDKATHIMVQAKKTVWYRIDNSFHEAIDIHFTKIKDEISTITYYTDIVIPHILELIAQNPGIMQKELYLHFADLDSQHLQWVFKHLAKDGKISRIKKQNSYALYLK